MTVVLTLVRINIHKRNNTKNTVQTIQNTVNTSTHITKTPTHYKIHAYTHPHIHTHTHTHTFFIIPVHFYIPVSNHATRYRFFTSQYMKHNLLETRQYGFTENTKSAFGAFGMKMCSNVQYLLVWPVPSACQFAYNNYTADVNLTLFGPCITV